jgi:cellulose synthase (UDP-forming)
MSSPQTHEAPRAERALAPPLRRPVDEPVLGRWDRAAFAVLTAVNLGTIVWMLWRWFAAGDPTSHPLVFALATILLLVPLVGGQLRWLMLALMRRPQAIDPPPGLHVGVATTFVPSAEPIEMLEETVRELVAMDYPHDTWVLDEGDDPRVRALCMSLGARHFSRQGRPLYNTPDGTFAARTKHGNYNAWLADTGFGRYDVIVAFDPDHVPERRFLDRVLGHFVDPAVGYVQAAQVYYNQDASFIARGAAEETYAYYSSHQMASYAMGHPIVTGCHNVHRATALADVGGFAPHDADDLLITLFYRSRGWRGVYVPEVLARGITPVDWDGYLKQQLRWARSVLDIKLRLFPMLARRLPPTERLLSLLHGLYYFRGVSMLFAYGLLAYLLATGTAPRLVSAGMLAELGIGLAVLQVSNLYRQRFFLERRREWGVHWRSAILQLAKWPWFVLALWQAVLRQPVAYSITAKRAGGRRGLFLLWPHLAVAATLLGTWAVGTASGHVRPPSVLGWAVVTIVGSLLLAWSGAWQFPPPYERGRWRRSR